MFCIVADHEHMMDLKHTIHVKEVNEAPAHEPHVLELHRFITIFFFFTETSKYVYFCRKKL